MIKRIVLAAVLLLPSLAAAQTQYGRIQTDQITNKSVISITGATPDVSQGNVFKTANGATTTVTNFLGGVASQRITIICGDTNTTIQNGASIVTASGSDITCTLNQTADFIYDAAQAKWVQVSGGSSGGGSANPAGSNGDFQCKNGSNLAACSINDNGTDITASKNFSFSGPNPTIDVSNYGTYYREAFNVPTTTTGSITSGTTTLTLAAASNFANGQGVRVNFAGPATTLTTPTAGTCTVKGILNGATPYAYTVRLEDINGAMTAAGSACSTSSGAATLGANSVTVSSATRSGGVTTYTTSVNHNFQSGRTVEITGFTGSLNNFNGVKVIASTPTGNTFTVNESAMPDATDSSGGTAKVIARIEVTWGPTGSSVQTGVVRAWIYRDGTLVGSSPGMDPVYEDIGNDIGALQSPYGYVPTSS